MFYSIKNAIKNLEKVNKKPYLCNAFRERRAVRRKNEKKLLKIWKEKQKSIIFAPLSLHKSGKQNKILENITIDESSTRRVSR